ncbi:MAG: hypothetical protein ABI790_12795 [Betaproteobacteria bacterium]
MSTISSVAEMNGARQARRMAIAVMICTTSGRIVALAKHATQNLLWMPPSTCCQSKLQHRRGFWRLFARNTAPVLEFTGPPTAATDRASLHVSWGRWASVQARRGTNCKLNFTNMTVKKSENRKESEPTHEICRLDS